MPDTYRVWLRRLPKKLRRFGWWEVPGSDLSYDEAERWVSENHLFYQPDAWSSVIMPMGVPPVGVRCEE